MYDGLALWYYDANTAYTVRYDACKRCCVDGQASYLPFPLYLLRRVLLGLVYSCVSEVLLVHPLLVLAYLMILTHLLVIGHKRYVFTRNDGTRN